MIDRFVVAPFGPSLKSVNSSSVTLFSPERWKNIIEKKKEDDHLKRNLLYNTEDPTRRIWEKRKTVGGKFSVHEYLTIY